MTLAEWVRQTLKTACQQEPLREQDPKRAALRAAMEHSFPAPDIDEMLREIAAEYPEDLPQ